MKQRETIEQYLERHSEQAATMNLSDEANCSRQNARNEKRHRLRRLNLATLKSSSFALVAQLSDATSDNGRSC